jgi:ubiquitin-like 1-activating enzyme E1 A
MTDAKQKAPTESDVYDRQIRLWGAESQAKMKNSKVLYIHVTGTSTEVLKNMVLAGVAATLCDPRPMEAMDLAPHFFSPLKSAKKVKYNSVAHAVQPLVEDLNMLLGKCDILDKQLSDLNEEDLKAFTVIVASQIPLSEATRLAQLASQNGRQFYFADCFGYCGAAMMDVGKDFQYRPEQGKKILAPQPLKEYVPFSSLVDVPLHQAVNRFHKQPPKVYVFYRCLLEYQAKTGKWPSQGDFDVSIFQDYLKAQQVTTITDDELQALGKAGMAQVPAVCAVLGGMLGNEIIKVISGKGEPANNTILLDGTICKAWTFLVKPKAG